MSLFSIKIKLCLQLKICQKNNAYDKIHEELSFLKSWGIKKRMANYKTQAINLKSYNLGEADKIVVMYSRDHGIIRCVAKGVRKPSSKLGGRMEMLMANRLFVAKGKQLDILCQAESIDTFKDTRKDLPKLTYSLYCAELINNFGLENDTNSSCIYDLFYETLKNISLSGNITETLWTIVRFQYHLLSHLGYAVELDTCVKCNDDIKNNTWAFCPESGGVICTSCKRQASKLTEIDLNIIKLLKEIELFDFPETQINQDLLNTCFNILKEYLSLRCDKKLKSCELIECLC